MAAAPPPAPPLTRADVALAEALGEVRNAAVETLGRILANEFQVRILANQFQVRILANEFRVCWPHPRKRVSWLVLLLLQGLPFLSTARPRTSSPTTTWTSGMRFSEARRRSLFGGSIEVAGMTLIGSTVRGNSTAWTRCASQWEKYWRGFTRSSGLSISRRSAPNNLCSLKDIILPS